MLMMKCSKRRKQQTRFGMSEKERCSWIVSSHFPVKCDNECVFGMFEKFSPANRLHVNLYDSDMNHGSMLGNR